GYGTHTLKENHFMSGKRIVMLTPNSKLKIKNNLYTVRDVPLGELKREIFGTTVFIPDAREISVNGKKGDSIIFLNDRIVIIGTNSPQLIQGIDSIVRKYIK